MNGRKKTYLTAVLIGLVLTVILIGCGNEGSDTEETALDESVSEETETLKIVSTFYPMYDFAQNVAQEEAEVSLMVPAGTDTHAYEPSAQDMAQIQEADVFIYSSEEMETWVPAALEAVDSEDLLVINASEGISFIENSEEDDHDHDHDEDHDEEEEEEEHSHAVDPHVWLDPVLAQEQVINIRDGLIEADPENQEIYENNAAAYNEALQELDQDYEAALSDAENRTFVTQHAAFAYLADRYNLEQVSIAGLSTEEEPSPAVLAELNEYVTEHDIHYIYYGTTASSAIAETLANEADVELAVLNPIEGFTAEEQEAGLNYIEAMRSNLEALQLSIQ